jgi:UDP-glucose 4-epimerase
MKTIFVTGCAGLLGNHYSRFLLNKGYRVIGIDNLFGGYLDYTPNHEKFSFHHLSLDEDHERLKDLFKKHKPHAVYHFAAYAAEGLSPFVRRFNYQNNIISSVNVINNCVEFDCKLIFTSTMAVYGCSVPPFTDDLTPTPCDPYGIAKYAVEMDIKQAGVQFGLRYNIIRPHNVLGIYQNIWDKYRNVIGIFIRRTLDREPILVYGDGEQTRAFSDIDYYMEPFYQLIDGHDEEIFNIGADKHWSLNEVAEIVRKTGEKYGYSNTIEHAEARLEVKDAYCNHDKAKNFLSFKDETNLDSLVDKMFNWAKDQPKRELKTMNYEINKGIYSYWR